MCVIIVKPAGVEMPSREELSNAHRCNPHGMGFASPSIQCKTMSFEMLCKKLRMVPFDEPCIIHFRLATHGSVKKANCHPFKAGDVYFAHNGILPVSPVGDMTDSETAFRTILYPEICRYGINSPQASMAVKSVIGSGKFAFLENGRLSLFGHFERHNGLYYSNTRHLVFKR